MAARLVEEHAAAAAGDDHRHLAARRRTCGQLGEGAIGGAAGELVDVVEVEQLEADGVADALAAGLHAGVAGGHAADGEERADGVVLREEAVGVGHEDAAAVVAVAHRHLGDGASHRAGDVVGAGEQLDLAGLGHVTGVGLDVVAAGRGATGEGDGAGAPSPALGGGRGGLGGGEQAGLGEVGGVGEAGGVAHHDPDAGAAVAARRELLDPAVVEQRRAVAPVLGEDLGEVTARLQGRPEHPLQHRFLDHRRSSPCRLPRRQGELPTVGGAGSDGASPLDRRAPVCREASGGGLDGGWSSGVAYRRCPSNPA